MTDMQVVTTCIVLTFVTVMVIYVSAMAIATFSKLEDLVEKVDMLDRKTNTVLLSLDEHWDSLPLDVV